MPPRFDPVSPLSNAARSDSDLVMAAHLGEGAAVSELYSRHARRLRALALRILHDERDAEDLVHDVFIEAWEAAEGYDEQRGSVIAWLTMRLKTRALDRLRTRRTRERVKLVMRAVETTGFETLPGTPDHSRLEKSLQCLGPKVRPVVELMYFDGLSYSEIAQELHIPIGTVRSRMHKGMNQLRELFVGVRTP